MKAIVYHQYGSPDVLQLREIAEPVVGDNDVLVRVRAASANPYDWHFMRGSPLFMRLQTGLFKPKKQSLGADLAGQVEAVGKNVSTFSPGDEVFGFGGGSFAEYVCVQQDMLALKPENLSFEQAAAVPLGGLNALRCATRRKTGLSGTLSAISWLPCHRSVRPTQCTNAREPRSSRKLNSGFASLTPRRRVCCIQTDRGR